MVVRQRASVLLTVAVLAALFPAVLAQAETAPADAVCTDGFTLYRESGPIAIVGCYRYFHRALTWNQALSVCSDVAEGSIGGVLAPARTQGEHDFLVGLRSDVTDRFWISGNSRSGTWVFEGVSRAVDMNAAYVVGRTINDLWPLNKALLDGHPGSFFWSFEDANVRKESYVCRRPACSPNFILSGGLCAPATAAQASRDDDGWVIAVIVLAVLVALVLLLLLLLFLCKRDVFDDLLARCCCCCGDRAGKVRPKTPELLLHARLVDSAETTSLASGGRGRGAASQPPVFDIGTLVRQEHANQRLDLPKTVPPGRPLGLPGVAGLPGIKQPPRLPQRGRNGSFPCNRVHPGIPTLPLLLPPAPPAAGGEP